ncbi:MAG TPA: DUF4131 domain-containing protein, partial [Vicinamibacteria bacterium]|nr:DUF4131 domain-containing protein [Vicinamibacteria bacterium]
MERPLLWLALAFAAGCGAGPGLGAPECCVLLALAAAGVSLAWFARAGLAAAGLAVAGVAVGAAAAAGERLGHERAGLVAWIAEPRPGPVLVSARLAEDALSSDGRSLLVLDVDGVTEDGVVHELDGRVRVAVGGEAPLPEALEGDRVRLWTTLREPAGNATPGARDASREARREGVAA